MLWIPNTTEKPPTIYSILQSIVNYNVEDVTKIKNLAEKGRTTIFNFDYPLTDKIDRAEFETLILKHFLMRRIGFDTVTAFRIQLDVKLNEIMPFYNKMFDAVAGWDIFQDGDITTKEGSSNRNTDTNTKVENTSSGNSTVTNNNTSDRRFSDLPQSNLVNVQDASYITNYNLDKNNTENISEESASGETNTNSGTKDNNEYTETVKRTPSDKIAILKEMQENMQNIYTLIFKDLECLFYQLI